MNNKPKPKTAKRRQKRRQKKTMKLTKMFPVRVAEEVYKRWQKRADSLGLDVAQWLRGVADEDAKKGGEFKISPNGA